MSAKVDTLQFGVRWTEADWIAFHEFQADGVADYEESEPAASKAVAIERLIELVCRADQPADGEKGAAK